MARSKSASTGSVPLKSSNFATIIVEGRGVGFQFNRAVEIGQGTIDVAHSGFLT